MDNSDHEGNLEIDWIHLPAETRVQGLWDSLHDVPLITIHSDLLNRSTLLTFDTVYIRNFHNLPEGTLFNFLLEGVTSARVATHSIWPGKFTVPKGASRAEEDRLIKEYQSKWREVSFGWDEFENLLKKRKNTFDISDAEVALGSRNCALRLSGHIQDKYYSVFIRAFELIIKSSDGKTLTVDEFVKLGTAYWSAFSEGKLKS